MSNTEPDVEKKGKIIYDTPDMWLAGYLMSKGASMEGIQGQKGNKRKLFRLSCSADVVQWVSDYYNRRGSVEPRDYKGRLADLRDILRSNSNVIGRE